MELEQNTQSKKRRMLECLADSKGIVTVACKNASIERKTHYQWLKKDAKYLEAVTDIQNVAIDYVEGKLFECIDKLKEASIIFFLKTRGRERGYSEQSMEPNGDNEEEVILPDIPELPEEDEQQ